MLQSEVKIHLPAVRKYATPWARAGLELGLLRDTRVGALRFPASGVEDREGFVAWSLLMQRGKKPS